MSYEIDSVKEIKCPCGKGIIKKVSKSNEWNQYKEDVNIICDDCEKIFIIEKEFLIPEPKHESIIYYCKNKKDNTKIKLDI